TPFLSFRTAPHRTVPTNTRGSHARTRHAAPPAGAEHGAAPSLMALAARPKSAAELLTLGEAARLAGVHRETVRAWTRKGALSTVRPAGGRDLRVRRVDLERLI